MRLLFALTMAALLGCAHQTSAENQAPTQPTAQAETTPAPQPMATEATAQQQTMQPAVESASTETGKPQPIAGADPSSSPNTCGLVRVHFETDKADLDDDDKALLTSTADCLKSHQQLRVNIEGNADERGPTEHNKQLSEQRSKVVSEFLSAQGVSSDQIKLLSFGENNPRCTESDAACWAKNRRTAIRPTCHM
jgi:peptidoglycan-associated lipoprotein